MWAGYAWLCVCFLLGVLFLNERATFNMLAGSDSDHVKSMSPRQIETCIKRWCHMMPSESEMALRSAAELKELCRACQREWTPVPNMTLAFHDLVVKGDDFTILEKASGEFLPGKLTAIMGSSGDGKSTLINAIRGSTSGYRDVQGGVVFDNRRMSVRAAGAVLRPLTGVRRTCTT
jgi:ABC-type protease/lipase transport system fused ATPase/permease subunit